ncbi:MAG: helix-turn-helix domain-containing protein [Oscillibacter sp.]|nr:helix-turn-helix domain-containing protein [Oscillibacter sp.]
MYKLLIADDEQKDRSIVRILIEKQYPDLFEILEAQNGTRALELLQSQRIDLLLLDMSMPGLSGMGVLREFKGSTYTIILTAYSFFDYARDALHYGVKDYILKPPIRAEFYAAIDRFLQERRSGAGDLGLGKKALRQELALQLCFYSDPRKIENYCRLLGLQDHRVSLAVQLGGGPQRPPEENLAAAERFLDAHPVKWAAASVRDGLAVLLFWQTEEERDAIRRFFPLVQSQIGGEWEFRSEVGSYQEIPRLLVELHERQDAGRPGLSSAASTAAIEEALRAQDFNEALRRLTDGIGWYDYGARGDAIKFQLVLTLSACTKHLFANAGKRGAHEKLSALLAAENQEQLLSSTAEYLHWVIREIQQSVYTNSYMVHRVIAAVELDCAKNWTIEGLASDLKISPYYLSHLFKEHTGKTFTDYLAERRIERAIELMQQPALTLAQIGEMVGYPDQNYFSRVFKKRSGISARQYRKQLLSE